MAFQAPPQAPAAGAPAAGAPAAGGEPSGQSEFTKMFKAPAAPLHAPPAPKPVKKPGRPPIPQIKKKNNNLLIILIVAGVVLILIVLLFLAFR